MRDSENNLHHTPQPNTEKKKHFNHLLCQSTLNDNPPPFPFPTHTQKHTPVQHTNTKQCRRLLVDSREQGQVRRGQCHCQPTSSKNWSWKFVDLMREGSWWWNKLPDNSCTRHSNVPVFQHASFCYALSQHKPRIKYASRRLCQAPSLLKMKKRGWLGSEIPFTVSKCFVVGDRSISFQQLHQKKRVAK